MPLIEMPASRMYRKYEDDAEAKAEFEERLKQRERENRLMEPAPGMISVQRAVAIAAAACPVEQDGDQVPSVKLIRDFYLVTFYENRRPQIGVTIDVAHIRVHARTGEVLGIQLREDLKPKP